MLEKLKLRYNKLTSDLSNPDIINNRAKYIEIAKEYSKLEELINEYKKLNTLELKLKQTESLYNSETDPELKKIAEEEIINLKSEIVNQQNKIKVLQTVKNPLFEKNIIMEIRAGTGGEESAIFASDLFRMYSRYAEKKGWKLEVLSISPSDLNGFKEIIFNIKGKNVYQFLRFEKGVHRVQRVPITEASGRIHTSAVTVAVLPEAEETDLQINPDDLKIDTYRASSKGGQHVQKTDSAVRITHLPTGMVVTCQDERSQHKNRERALKILRSRLLEKIEEERNIKISEERKRQIGSGDRSEKIRTYNFPQNRVTDHRIGLTLYKLETILDGDIDEIISAIQSAEEGSQNGI